MSIIEKLSKAQELVVQPVELSEPEQKRLKEIVDLMKESLEAMLIEALSKPRDEAFALVHKYLSTMQKCSSGVDLEEIYYEEKTVKPVERPKLNDILDALPPAQVLKAREMLDCVKNYLKLMEAGEDPTEIICPHCSPEEMMKCIRIADPSIRDDDEVELEEAREGTREKTRGRRK